MPGHSLSVWLPEDEWQLIKDEENLSGAIQDAVRSAYGDENGGEVSG